MIKFRYICDCSKTSFFGTTCSRGKDPKLNEKFSFCIKKSQVVVFRIQGSPLLITYSPEKVIGSEDSLILIILTCWLHFRQDWPHLTQMRIVNLRLHIPKWYLQTQSITATFILPPPHNDKYFYSFFQLKAFYVVWMSQSYFFIKIVKVKYITCYSII